jgi:diadenosine tetraphosphatase ApaH/serine/threonine PP2A family protein phosphatase
LRVALLSDIHANLEALQACLAHARERGVDGHALLGDLVGYGADAQATLDIVMRLVSDGAVAVKGNHDAAIERPDSYFNFDARASLDWARNTLRDEQRAFMRSLPLTVDRAPSLFVHASAASPARWDYVDSGAAAQRCVDAAQSTYTFCGHVHDQQLYFRNSRGRMSVFVPTAGDAIPLRGPRPWLAIVGSVGQPRDRNPAAAYAVFDDDAREITFYRVAYDQHAAAAKIRAAGLPEALAYRVEQGI